MKKNKLLIILLVASILWFVGIATYIGIYGYKTVKIRKDCVAVTKSAKKQGIDVSCYKSTPDMPMFDFVHNLFF